MLSKKKMVSKYFSFVQRWRWLLLFAEADFEQRPSAPSPMFSGQALRRMVGAA
jgi:hypothetical protein